MKMIVSTIIMLLISFFTDQLIKYGKIEIVFTLDSYMRV